MRSGLPVAALLLASCSVTPRTQVIVTIDAEAGVRAAGTNLHLRVLGGEGATAGPTAERFDRVLHPGTDDPGFPFSIAIAPLDHAVGRVYEITATALDESDGFVAEVRAVSGFLEGRTLHLRLVLEDACRGRMCASNETCRGGACRVADVRPEDLPIYGVDAGGVDVDGAPSAMDAADAPLDAGTIDAGPRDDGGVGCGPILPTPAAALVAAGGARNDEFGYAVALSADGTRMLVGSRYDDTVAGVNAGSASLFVWTGTAWSVEATLLASDGAPDDLFGYSVALSSAGDRAIVGMPQDGAPDTGSARVFVRSGTTWSEEATLVASGAGGNEDLGVSVALSADGTRALAGAYNAVGGAGAGTVSVFRRTGTVWTEEATLVGSGGATGDQLGNAVAFTADGTRALVGAWADDTVGGANAGSARVFVRVGTAWSEEAMLVASGGAPNDLFGISVAVSADGAHALVGAYHDDTVAGNDAGTVRVFLRAGSAWTEQATLVASDAAAGDEFGYSVALGASGTRALVGVVWDDTVGGVDAGSARVFGRTGTSWTEDATLLASDGAAGDWFGSSIALSSDGESVVVGVSLDDTVVGADSGSARPFVLTPPGSGIPGPAGHCYILVREASTSVAAGGMCAALGGHLATIGSSSEQMVAVTVSMGGGWIGATDEGSEGTWRWTTGESWVAPHWEATQPDNSGGAENCAAIYFPDGSWADVACNSMYPAVCEIP